MINSKLLVTLAQKLINQPSITPQDCLCQDIIACYLKKLNFYTELMCFQDTQNIWAYRTGSSNISTKQQCTLLFLGHTDVVPAENTQDWKYPPFSGCVHNGILYGRGASDMKGAIAAMLVAVKNFVEKYPNHKNRIAFLMTSDEEGTGLNGTVKVIESLLNRKEQIHYCIIGEPSSRSKIGDVLKNGRRGSYTGKLKIHGISGHTAYPQFLKNPIHLAIPALLTLLNNTTWDTKTSLLFPATSIQFTNIYTNSTKLFSNMTPNQLIVNFNFRFSDQTSVQKIKQNINNILSYYNLTYDIDQENTSEPYWSAPGTFTKVVIDIIKHYQKIKPILETTGGTSDGRFIKQMGSEIVELGALNQTIHKIDECIYLTDLYLLSSIYLNIMKKILV